MTSANNREIELAVKDAFFNNIEQILAKREMTKSDIEYIVLLFEEIRNRLCMFVSSKNKIHKSIHDSIDVDIFRNMLTHNAIEKHDLDNFVRVVFKYIYMFEAPYRQHESTDIMEKLLQTPEYIKHSVYIVKILRSVHTVIDAIESDIIMFRREIEKSQKSHV